MPHLERNEARLYYETYPAGHAKAWVSLVNGYTRSCSDFRLGAKKIKEAGFSVLLFDNRGAGQSTVTAPFGLKDMAEDVLALWEALGIASSHLMGISMGGLIAQSLAIAKPSRLLSLSLISTFASPAALSQQASSWPREEEGIKALLARYFAPSYRLKNPLLLNAMAKNIYKEVQEGCFQERAALQRQALAGFQADLLALSRLRLPTFILHGADDEIIPLREAETLAKTIPQARLLVLPNCGHLLLAEQPKTLWQNLLGFWQEYTI